MAASPANAAQSLLRRAFVDICRGYSVALYEGQPVYVRHLSHVHHLDYDLLQAQFEQVAIAQGALTEAQRMAQMRASGVWSEAKDSDIERQKDTIARFEDTIKGTPVPSVAQGIASQLADEKRRLNELLTEKATLLGMTAEAYAQRRLNDHYIATNLFADPKLTQPRWSAEVFTEMEDRQVEEIHATYHAAIEPCSDENLRRLAVQDLFTSYYAMVGDDLSTFYGRPICEMTYYQIRLGAIGRYFRHIIEKVDLSKLPPQVRHDPDALERHFTTKRNAEAMAAEGKMPVGMTSTDLQETGLKGQFTPLPQKEMNSLELVRHLQAQQRGQR